MKPTKKNCLSESSGSEKCQTLIVKLNTQAVTSQAFKIKGERAYYRLGCIHDGSVTVQKGINLRFTALNIYTVSLTVYPNGCPMAQLTIELEVKQKDALSTIDVRRNLDIITAPNTLTLKGEILPGTTLRFYTNARLLRYFTGIELVGQIVVSDAACIMNRITDSDNDKNIAYIPERPNLLNLIPATPIPPPGQNPNLPGQFPEARSIYPWTEALIPWEKDQPFPSGPEVIITPPDPIPPVPVLVDGYQDAYAKFSSIPDSLIFYSGNLPEEVSPTQENWTIFLRNFQDRGYAKRQPDEPEWRSANYSKRQYMSAISLDKMQFYQPKIDNFILTAYTEVVVNRKPLMSSFQSNLVLFFLSIHIGIDDYPDYIIEYFLNFIKLLGIADPDNVERQQLLIYGYNLAPKIYAYFRQRVTQIIATNDTSCISYWWEVAGLSREALVFEAIHNIVAFSQFSNTIYSVIYVTIRPENPLSPELPPYPDFLKLYREATDSDQRLNVIREAFRLLVPNSASFSAVNPDPETNTSKTRARHLHQAIMINNMPGIFPLGNYFTYQPDLYVPDFQTNLDGRNDLVVTTDFLSQLPTSELDQETVVDISRPIMPIFPKPIYAPFGLGYRRCPGEIFTYVVTEQIFQTFGQATYLEKPGDFPIIYVAPFKGVPDNIFAVQPIG